MVSYKLFLDLAIIVVAAKLFGLLARKAHAPQVVGEIIAGLVIGPNVLGLVSQSDFLIEMAEIGVILLMFMAGLETNLKDLLQTGPIAFLIACCGVFVPLGGGYLLYSCFYGFSAVGSDEFFRAIFIGVILTATSVSITVSALRELGKLRGKVGTTIMGAAIIDDVIGIIVLTFVIGFKDPSVRPSRVVINTVLFFVFAIGVGFVCYFLFKLFEKKHPHSRRVPIMGLALCLVMAYAAEEFFGIADITGAYVAGIILCSIKSSDYIAEKMDVSSYMLFGPIFFANIGLKTEIKGMTWALVGFSVAFILVGLITKVIGCGLMARICRFSFPDSLKIGVGMMTRGEVALIVSQKGLAVGLMDPLLFTSVILLIIVSSISTPIVLKLLYKNQPSAGDAPDEPLYEPTD
ncbi:MAG: cation:proton antiporter [Candidatus Merdivicinus sp.]|jgi:Kef-type K+ transport system membrane component KefB